MSAFETWRTGLDRTARFDGATPDLAVETAHKACGVGALDDFKAWLAECGLRPFSTGKGYVLNVPPDTPAHKLTAKPIPPSGAETY